MKIERYNVYKCAICGNIVETMHAGGGTLICCNQPMEFLNENTTDAANEKHVPVLEKLADGGVLVKVGEVEHPMVDKHFIQWIELVDEECGVIARKYLKPGDKPEATFKNVCTDCYEHLYAREYCNLHGHWKGK